MKLGGDTKRGSECVSTSPIRPRSRSVNNNAPVEPDRSQPEPENLIELVDKIYNEWQQRRNGAPAKLVRGDKSADHPDPKNEE